MTVGCTPIRDVLYPVREARRYYASQLTKLMTARSIEERPSVDADAATMENLERGAEGQGDEGPGTWLVIGSTTGMPTGPVTDLAPFLTTMDGRSPNLRFKVWNAGRVRRVRGTDLTFSLAKGVSLYLTALEEVGKADVADSIRGDADASIREALNIAYLTGTFMARRGSANKHTLKLEIVASVPATIWAHRTARGNDGSTANIADPQEHFHVYVPNLAQRMDGTWGALNGERIFKDHMMIGALFRADFAARLAARGLFLQKTGKGQFDLMMPITWVQPFSARRAEILRRMHEITGQRRTDANLASLARRTAVSSRGPKELLPPLSALKAEWTHRLSEWSANWTGVVRFVETSRLRSDPVTRDISDEQLIDDTCTSIITCRQVRTAVAALASSDGSLTAKAAIHRADHIIRRLVPLGRQRESEFFISTGLLERERRILQWSIGRQGEKPRLALPDAKMAIDRANENLGTRCGSGARLTAWQERHVIRLSVSAGGVKVLRGRSGSGKTMLLTAVAEAHRLAGHPVEFLVPNIMAAKRISEEYGVKATDIWNFAGPFAPNAGIKALEKRHVLIIDDAHMISTRRMDAVLEQAHATGAKVIIAGDERIVDSAYDQGLAFRTIVATDPEIRRPWPDADIDHDIQRACLDTVAGRPVEALLGLADAGRVDLVSGPDEALMKAAELVVGWITNDVRNGKSFAAAMRDNLVICASNVEARSVAEQIRSYLQIPDVSSFSQVVVTAGGAELKPVSHRMGIAVGDRITIYEAHEELGLVNGDVLTVEDTRRDHSGNAVIRAVQEPYGRIVIIHEDDLVVRGDRRGRRQVRLQHAIARTAVGARDLLADRVVVVATKPPDRQRVLESLAHHRVDCRIVVARPKSASTDKEKFIQEWAAESGLAFKPRCFGSLLDRDELADWVERGTFKGVAVGKPISSGKPGIGFAGRDAGSIKLDGAPPSPVGEISTIMASNAALETLTAEIAEFGRRVRGIEADQAKRDERFAAIMLELNAVRERQEQERRAAIDDHWEREQAANLRLLRRMGGKPPAEPSEPVRGQSTQRDDDVPEPDW